MMIRDVKNVQEARMVDNHLGRPGKPARLYRPGNMADALRQVGTPEEVISRHPTLVPYDMRLAELYRLSYQLPPPAPPPAPPPPGCRIPPGRRQRRIRSGSSA